MLIALAAVLAGLLVGLLVPARHRHLAPPQLRGWPLLGAGLSIQVAAGFVGGAPLVLVSYALLLAFAVRNLHFVGMPLVLLGLTLNCAVIAANGAMPVRPEALVAAGTVERAELASLDVGPKRRLEERGDRLTALADIVPLAPARTVVSFGDLVLYVGLADVVAHVVRRQRRRRSSEREPAGWTADDDAAFARLLASEPIRVREGATAP